MLIKHKKNRSGTTSVVVAEKRKSKYTEHITIGIAKSQSEIEFFEAEARKWIEREQER